MRRQAVDALAALEAARRAGADATLERQLMADTALLNLRLGRLDEARRDLAALADAPDRPRATEAMFWLGALRFVSSGDVSGGGWWNILVDEHPEDPWAWKAAANLLGAGALVRGHELVTWPSQAAFAEALPRAPAPVGADRAEEAERDAVAYLLRTQGSDGSWGDPREELSLYTLGYREAITSIAGASLLRFEDGRPAAERALRFVLTARAEGRLDRSSASAVWAQAFALRFLVRCARNQFGPPGELHEAIRGLVRSLRRRQGASGGWPYHHQLSEPGSDGGGTSFLTAAILIALVDALMITAVPDDVFERGAAFLRGLRQEDGSFRYAHDVTFAPRDAAEASGRGPLCALALHRVSLARREEGDLPGVKRALARLLRDREALRSERGKDLNHTGPQGQASYYFFFDYSFALEALRSLPQQQRALFVGTLVEDVLAARLADGSFVDTPSLGRGYATAMALDCLAR